MSQAIRLSPSGPIISNPGGAPLTPSTGARLRLAEATTTVGSANSVPTAANYAASQAIGVAIGSGPALTVSLTAPNVANNYRATALLDVTNPTTNALGTVQLYLETSFDGGATWSEQASNQHNIFGSTNGGQSRQIRVDLPLRTGASLGMAPGAPSITIRAKIGATVGGGLLTVPSGDTGDAASKGTVLLQLEEMF